MVNDDYNKVLKQFHKLSNRHILVAETDMSCSDIQKVVKLSDRIRKAGNELIGLMKRIMTSSCVPKGTAYCLNFMAPLKISRNAKCSLTSSMKCRNNIMLHGITAASP